MDARSGPIAAARFPLTEDAVEFLYRPVEPDHAPAVLLTILMYHRDNWAVIAAESGSAPGVVVAAKADDVFVAAVAGANPYPAGSHDADLFEGMRLTEQQVKDALAPH